MPKIGRGSAKKTRHMLPSGFKKMLIKNTQDIELLLMNNRTYCAEIANSVSARKRYYFICPMFHFYYRKEIIQRAKELKVRLTNAHAKLKKQSAE